MIVLKISLCFLLVHVLSVNSLDCYSCNRGECEKNDTIWDIIKDCNNDTTSNYVPICTTIQWTEKATLNVYYERDCNVGTKYYGTGVSYVCPKSESEFLVTSCDICREDLCNVKELPIKDNPIVTVPGKSQRNLPGLILIYVVLFKIIYPIIN